MAQLGHLANCFHPLGVAAFAVEDVLSESIFLFEGSVAEWVGTPKDLGGTAFGHGGQRRVLGGAVGCFQKFIQLKK